MGGRHRDAQFAIRMWSWKYMAIGLVVLVAMVSILIAISH